MGRPATRKITYRDGFYIEISAKLNGHGMKVRRDTAEEAQALVKQYGRTKNVRYLGEVVKGKFIDLKKK